MTLKLVSLRLLRKGYNKMDDNIEVWVDIIEFPGYAISSFGRVKGPQTQLLSYSLSNNGYRSVGCYKNGKRHGKAVASLVADAFLPSKPTDKHQINHKDTDKKNNCSSNLEWTTPLKNIRHAIKAGVFNQIGVNNSSAKLNDNLVQEIRKEWSNLQQTLIIYYKHGAVKTKKKIDLAQKYDVSYVTIENIVYGITWKHLL